MKAKTKIILSSIVVFFVMMQGVYATNYHASSTGNWQDGPSWSGGVVPPTNLASTDTVFIDDGVILTIINTGGTYVLDYSGSAPFVIVINSSSTQTTLNLNGATLKLPDLSAVQLPNNISGIIGNNGSIIIGTETVFNTTSKNGPAVLKSSNGALPVELLYFHAKTQGKYVSLNWKTASEQNSESFDIERSNDGVSWEVVGSKTAAGNSNVVIDYELIDMVQAEGIYYYRLVQKDFDGKTEVFGPIQQRVGMDNEELSMKIFPNPVTNHELSIRFNEEIQGGATIQICDYSGRVLQTQVLESNVQMKQLDVSNLPKGIYIVRYISSNKEITSKLIIE